MSIDFEQAVATFDSSTDFTVGIEEEFAILNPETLDLDPSFEDLQAAAQSSEILRDSLVGELISSEVEIRSGAGKDLSEAMAKQRDARLELFALSDSKGLKLAATGTHPWADYRQQKIIDTEHYRLVSDSLKYVAWRNNTFSMHVHVGVKGIDRAVKICDRLRPVLPHLLAISANSPFLDGIDSGLHSARTQTFTKSFPRCGVPDSFGGWDAYREYLELLLATNSIIEYTQVWWSVRPHLSFGTVEVRICDAQITSKESENLAALIVAVVAQAARDIDEGRPALEVPGRLIEENFWRAIRSGQDASFIDFASNSEVSFARASEQLLQWVEPACKELKLACELPEQNGAQRQRQALASGASLHEIYHDTVKQTHSTYGEQVVKI